MWFLTLHHTQGYYDGKDVAHDLLPQAAGWGAAAVTLHGRTRQQRCARSSGMPLAELATVSVLHCQQLGQLQLKSVGSGPC